MLRQREAVLIDAEHAMNLECNGFEFCPEVTAKALRLGLAIREVPVSYTPCRYDDGKKIRLADGFSALLTLWKWRKWDGEWSPARTGVK